MTASEVARHFGAKKAGRGKWIARCTAHPDRSPSLTIAEGRTAVVIKCQSSNCDPRDILKNAGLRFTDLFYDSRKPAPRITSLHNHLDSLDRQAGLTLWLSALEKPHYWRAAYKRIMREYNDLRHQLYMEEGTK